MKGRYCFVLFILLFLSACNGKRVETRSALEKMLESRIHLPKEVRCVYEGEDHTMYIGKDSRVKMVEAMGIHHGPAKSINHCR